MASVAKVALGAYCALWMLNASSSSTAQDQPANIDEHRKEQALEHMRTLALRQPKSTDAAEDEPIELIDHPLLTYGEPTRRNETGWLWAFSTTGRPAVFVELFRAPPADGEREVWRHALTLTSDRLPVMTTPIETSWTPATTQIESTPFPEAPLPHAKEITRLRQMKELAGRFTAHEFWGADNQRFELRLLVQPVHRYSDPKAGLHDGAVFIFANGTNPEIILLIEAIGERLETARWHYSLARQSSAETHVQLGGNEVWQKDRTRGPLTKPTEPYWLFMSPVDEPAKK